MDVNTSQYDVLHALDMGGRLVRRGAKFVIEGDDEISITMEEMRQLESMGYLAAICQRNVPEDRQRRRLTGAAIVGLRLGEIRGGG